MDELYRSDAYVYGGLRLAGFPNRPDDAKGGEVKCSQVILESAPRSKL